MALSILATKPRHCSLRIKREIRKEKAISVYEDLSLKIACFLGRTLDHCWVIGNPVKAMNACWQQRLYL